MKRLIEDYKRRLKTIQEEIAIREDRSPTDVALIRYRAKQECYRTFIVELERELNNK